MTAPPPPTPAPAPPGRTADVPALAAALVTVVLWASAFVGIRAATDGLSSGALALGRLLVASLVLGAMVLVARHRAGAARSGTRVTGRDRALLALCGVLWFGAYNVVLNEGERRVDAGTAAMLVNVGPVLIAILAGIVLREGLPRSLARGLPVAFAGAIVIGLATRSSGETAGTGAVLCVVAAVLYAAGVVTQKPLLARHSALDVTFAACAAGTIVCLPFAPALIGEVADAGTGPLLWTVFLGVFPTAVAFTTWAYALSRTTAGRMGATTYLVPPLAVLLGWLLLGEAPPTAALAGGALCLAGVALTRR